MPVDNLARRLPPPPPPPPPRPPPRPVNQPQRQALSRGDRGQSVKALQERLSRSGFDPGPRDGKFGARTEQAVRGFQRSQMLNADGRANKDTIAALNRDSFEPARGRANAGAASAAASGSAGGVQRMNNTLSRLDVEHNRRYLPSGVRGTSSRVTHCNEFAQDVLRGVGVPRQDIPSGNANNMNRFLNNQGAAHGWHQVSAAEAQRRANAGHPVLASWRNNNGPHGHVAVVRPSNAGGVRIAQAGGHNYNDAPVSRGFGRATPQYFAYDR